MFKAVMNFAQLKDEMDCLLCKLEDDEVIQVVHKHSYPIVIMTQERYFQLLESLEAMKEIYEPRVVQVSEEGTTLAELMASSWRDDVLKSAQEAIESY